MRYLTIIISVFLLSGCKEETKFISLEKTIEKHKKILGPPAENPEKFEVQIIYTQIDRDASNNPSFTNYEYNVAPEKYYYPASTIKMPLAFLALEKLNLLRRENVNKYSSLKIDSVRAPQTAVRYDSSSQDYKASIAHYIKKIFLVSDNDASNRLYEFLGQDYINDRLSEKDFKNVRFVHRLGNANFGPKENRFTNPITFYHNDKPTFRQDEVAAVNIHPNQLSDAIKGKGFIDSNDSLILEPFNFTQKNFVGLRDHVGMLRSVLFPESMPRHQQFQLNRDDEDFLLKYMSMYPGESDYPKYGPEKYESYVKFFMFGDRETDIPKNIRIFNKVGYAYGYLTDIAYIVDFENKIEFMLAATVHVNENQIYNDGVYEYDEIGLPFLAELGNVIYHLELKRPRANEPSLSKFNVH